MTRRDLPFDPHHRLFEALGSLIGREQRIHDHLRNRGSRMPEQLEDWVQLLEDDEVLSLLDDTNRQRVAQVRAALARVEAGTYGLSVHSGRPIKPERLQAIPWVSQTIDEARAAEGAPADSRPTAPADATRKAEPITEVHRGSVDDDSVQSYGGPAR